MILQSTFTYHAILTHYIARDTNYKRLPLDSDWLRYEKIKKLLSIFNNVTKIIFGTSYPIFLPYIMYVESRYEDEYIREMDVVILK